jgi:hypothetical protein
MPYPNIREEELKNKVATDYFADFDCTQIIGNIDFCISSKFSKTKKYCLKLNLSFGQKPKKEYQKCSFLFLPLDK